MVEDPPAPGLLPPDSLVDGRFRIIEHLAQGGMGDIYRAEHVLMKRTVALKLLRPEWAALPEMATRFQREAQLVSQLDHPFIVRVFDFGRTPEGVLFLSMELVDGASLEAKLQALGPWSPLATIRLIRHICSALAVAHARGIVHRDLKPENILLTHAPPAGAQSVEQVPNELFPKILDFGIARLADSSVAEGSNITRMGMTLGTPDYLSPEQALAQPLDARTDLYSLSVVAYRMLAGRLPFMSDDPRQLLSFHINTEPPALPSLQPELARVPLLVAAIHRGMEKDRARRFDSAAELSGALEAAEGEARAYPQSGTSSGTGQPRGSPIDPTVLSKAAAVTARAPAPRLRSRWSALGIGLAALGAAGAAGWAISRWANPSPAAQAAATRPTPPAPATSPPPQAVVSAPPAPPAAVAPAPDSSAGTTPKARKLTPADQIQSFVDELIPPKHRAKKPAHTAAHTEEK